MKARKIKTRLLEYLDVFPAVAMLGPRQVGKTTLALEVGKELEAVYLDLESPADRNKLREPELYLSRHRDRLVILDEIHRAPEIFQPLRGLIDAARRRGRKAGQYLLLGSASMDLLQQTGESLAGRIGYLELTPLDISEIDIGQQSVLWLRGGFPESLLARDGKTSLLWRQNFIRTCLERDIPALGRRIPAETLRRFWTMLAHQQGQLLNAAQLARGLAVDGKTVASYLDLMVDLLLVRRLPPLLTNVGKRLVRSPRTYVRDSGLVHALLGLADEEELLGSPVAGSSWEGLVLETLINAAPEGASAAFYRTAAGAEIDLVLDIPGHGLWAFEIKLSLSPRPRRGFHHACDDLKPDQRMVVYPGQEDYALSETIEAVGFASAVN
ncbi:MAG: ATP-binding protein, partial [Wenzhouxiangella sp.]